MSKPEFYRKARAYFNSYGGIEESSFIDQIYVAVFHGDITEVFANTLDFDEYKRSA